jgi:hypothetical protein
MGFFKRLFGRSKPADLLPPPQGFTWQHFEEVRIAILQPDGWYVHQVGDDKSFTGCVSKECIQTEGSFKTGLTLLVFRRVKDGLRERHPDGFDPDYPVLLTLHGRGYPDTLSDPQLVQVLYCDPVVHKTQGSRLYRFQYRQLAPSRPDLPWHGPIIVQKSLIDFDQSSDVYEFTFESPARSWDESWQKGKPILTNLAFSVNAQTNLMFSFDPPLPPDDVLQVKALEVGRALGWSLAHENRSEGLFIWRFQLPARDDPSRTIGGCFSWYMKRVGNEIWVDDPVQFRSDHGVLVEELAELGPRLQADFKGRWLALVGPVTLRGASPQTHSAELQARAMGDLVLDGTR